MLSLIAAVLALAPVPAEAGFKVDPKLARKVYTCKTKGAKKHVWIMKVLQVDPKTDTQRKRDVLLSPIVQYSQAYRQLDAWVGKGMKTFVTQGCFGEVDESFKFKPNGWGLAELRASLKDKGYEDLVTMPATKLKAKHGAKIRAYCGDDPRVQAHEVAMDRDLRGNVGVLDRYTRFKAVSPEALEIFRKNSVEFLKMPPSSTAEDVVEKLKTILRENYEGLKIAQVDRDRILSKAIVHVESRELVAIVEDIHGTTLPPLLEKAGIACDVLEPEDYNTKPEEFVRELGKILGDV